MLNSGHQLEQVRKHIMSGLQGFERKRKRCAATGAPRFHLRAKECGPARRKTKLGSKIKVTEKGGTQISCQIRTHGQD
jgi:hypothetical protein